LVSEVRGGVSKVYHPDSLGTTRAATNSSGTINAALETDAFGNTVSALSSGNVGPFGFGGQHGYQSDSDSGLMRLGHRYYDASTGRFISRDLIQAGDNWYTYCQNDPVNAIDPTGLIDVDEGLAKTYPKAAKFIRNLNPTPTRRQGMSDFSGATEQQVNDALVPGGGPVVTPGDLVDSNGQFTPVTGAQTIIIDQSVLEAFEKGRRGSRTLLRSTLEHETVHYLDNLDGIDHPGEEGQLYEEYIYGEDIDTLREARRYERR